MLAPAPLSLVPISEVDPDALEALLDRVFGPDRHARTASRVRAGASCIAEASFAAIQNGRLAGSVAVHRVYWCLPPGPRRPLAWLGPLAREPERHGDGIGMMLMARALAVLDAMALDVALIGDAPYYARWGFSAEGTAEWTMPGPVDRQRLLLRARDRGAWAGRASLHPCPAVAPQPA